MKAVLVGAIAALGLLAVAAGVGWLWLDRRAAALFTAPLDFPLDSIAVPGDLASVAEGERLAWLRGCHGCHDDSLTGKVFLDEPRVLRLVAPNVTAIAPSYSDAELARLIRHGLTRTGRPVLAMPSATFYHLSDGDVGRIIAHLRAVPRREASLPPTELRLMAKIGLVAGKVPTDAATMDHRAPRLGDLADTSQEARGEYLARTICAECHGPTLRGEENAPSLAAALGYTLPQFVSLLCDGRARDGRDLGLMRTTARRRFVRFRRDEIEAIWAYVRSLPPALVPGR